MDDYISRQASINAIGNIPDYEDGMVFEALSHAQRDVALLPPADVQPVRHGHWIDHTNEVFPADSTIECSVCHEHESVLLAHDNYCPNCGAKMDGEEDG